jgi:hypothetical protein
MSKRMTFVQAMKDYFGLNGKTNTDFIREMQALTTADRDEFRKLLPTVGYEIADNTY